MGQARGEVLEAQGASKLSSLVYSLAICFQQKQQQQKPYPFLLKCNLGGLVGAEKFIS